MLLPINRTAVDDIRDYCRMKPRDIMYVEQLNFHINNRTDFYAWPTMPEIMGSTVCVWRIYPKGGAYAD